HGSKRMTDVIVIRAASEEDLDFIRGLVPSLLEFGSPLWQDPSGLASPFNQVLARAVQEQNANTAVLVAEAADDTRLGFISVRVVEDPVTGGKRVHVADLAVTPAAHRTGVGRALMSAGESWAHDRGAAIVTLDVWSTNHRALDFYRALGFSTESLSLAKRL
ncbi:MAG: GNAT family N-acetyltransferase, partial [Solirubrobacteraceae bacterium]